MKCQNRKSGGALFASILLGTAAIALPAHAQTLEQFYKGKNINLIIPAERQSEVEDTLRRIGWGEKIEHNETIRRRKDGSLVEVSLSISPIKAPSGK